MMRDDEEADLRQAFAALRREDAEQAPPFDGVLTAAQLGRGRRRLVPILGGLAASVAAIVIVVVAVAVRHPPSTPPRVVGIEQWTAPTDFLLRTPGREILETTPRIGARPFLVLPEGASASGPLRK
jgi:hypothetical protein